MATASLASSKAKVRASATGCGQLHAPRLGRGAELGACRIAHADRDESVPAPRAQRDAGHECPATFGVRRCWRLCGPRPVMPPIGRLYVRMGSLLCGGLTVSRVSLVLAGWRAIDGDLPCTDDPFGWYRPVGPVGRISGIDDIDRRQDACLTVRNR
jgi:hypothetical protein